MCKRYCMSEGPLIARVVSFLVFIVFKTKAITLSVLGHNSCIRHTAAMLGVLIVVSACATTQPPNQDDDSDISVDLFLVSVEAQRAYQESRWLDAVRLYQQIVEHAPEDAIAWFRLANTYAQQGAFDRAVHAYEQSLSNDNDQPKAWFNLSTVYLLNAQSSMRQSHARMRHGDPARDLIEARLNHVGNLLHGRIEESIFSSVGSVR